MERTTLTERLRWAETEIAAGRPEQALGYCQELQTTYPRALRVQRVLGEVYLALRKPREALAALDRALAGDPEDVRACCARALVHQMHGDDISALAWYRRACDLRPDDQSLRATFRTLARRLGEAPYRPSRAGLARLYLRGDLFAHAIREWEQLVTESPDRLDAQVGLAETLWLAGHARAAEERCRRILANAPFCVKAMLIQMALALAEGDMDAARAHLQRTHQLDPDMAIAQTVFADALASGDPVLTPLLRGVNEAESGDDTVKMGRVNVGFAQSGPRAGQRNISRPLVTSAPVAEPAFGASQPISQPLPPPPRPEVPVASQPTEVTRAFKETAFMIWSQDEDSQPRITAQHPGITQAAYPAAPPALHELGGAMDDEETRRALNWYNWLQAQGAVALGATATSPTPTTPPPVRPHGTTIPIHDQPNQPDQPTAAPSSDAANSGAGMPPTMPAGQSKRTMPIPPAAPMPAAPTPAARTTMPIPPSLPMPPMPPMPADMQSMDPRDEEQQTMPLPLPSPEALRTMFAELGDTGSAVPVVESGNAHQAPNTPTMPNTPNMAGTPDGRIVEANPGADQLSGALWPPASATPSAPAPAPGDQSDNMMGDQAALDRDEKQQAAPQTIEAMERQFAASGFTHIETRPGLLAEIERQQQANGGMASREQSQEQSADDKSAPPVSATPATPVAPPTSAPVATGPDPRDYPARLAHARQRRDDGQIDEALNEYRVIIKNAPDLLPEVLSDLQDSLADLPDHSNLHSVLGDALVSQGEYEKALESYNKATELAQARNAQG